MCKLISAGGWLAGTVACVASLAGLMARAVIYVGSCVLVNPCYSNQLCCLFPGRLLQCSLRRFCSTAQRMEAQACLQGQCVAMRELQLWVLTLRRGSGATPAGALTISDRLLRSMQVETPWRPARSEPQGGSTLHALSCLL